MKYNCTIQNMGALPIPYSVVQDADNVRVGRLFKDGPMFVNLSYIAGGIGDCIILNCNFDGKPAKVIFPVDEDLNIKFVEGEK